MRYTVSTVTLICAVIALILAYFLLSEPITATQLAAIVAITGFVAAEFFYDRIAAYISREKNTV